MAGKNWEEFPVDRLIIKEALEYQGKWCGWGRGEFISIKNVNVNWLQQNVK